MADTAALITALAALFAALAWPVTLIVGCIVFRRQLRAAAERMPGLFAHVRRLKIGPFEAELEKAAQELVEEAEREPGRISYRQIRSAARVELAAKNVPHFVLRNQLEELAGEYETIRRQMAPGKDRNRAMIAVLVKMRTLGPSLAADLPDLMRSPSAGKRLAAVAIMQVEPGLTDFDWILDRFRSDAPFIFYQSALVLENAARSLPPEGAAKAMETAASALAVVEGYQGGEPDRPTVVTLSNLVARAA